MLALCSQSTDIFNCDFFFLLSLEVLSHSEIRSSLSAFWSRFLILKYCVRRGKGWVPSILSGSEGFKRLFLPLASLEQIEHLLLRHAPVVLETQAQGRIASGDLREIQDREFWVSRHGGLCCHAPSAILGVRNREVIWQKGLLTAGLREHVRACEVCAFWSSPAAGGIWLWSQVADMKLNDSELDLCSGPHLTNSVFPSHFEAMVFGLVQTQWVLSRGRSLSLCVVSSSAVVERRWVLELNGQSDSALYQFLAAWLWALVSLPIKWG